MCFPSLLGIDMIMTRKLGKERFCSMNKEKILESSRRENKNRYLAEMEVTAQAGNIAGRVGATVCVVLTLVFKMSNLYGVSLDYLLKGDSPMKNYLDHIEESTNVVKSKVKLSKLILILSYLVIWAFNIMVSWFFSAESISEAQAGAFQWLVLPVATIVISLPFL